MIKNLKAGIHFLANDDNKNDNNNNNFNLIFDLTLLKKGMNQELLMSD